MLQKTEITVFRSRLKLIGKLKIIFNGQWLNSTSSIKYLSVFLDEHLSWNKHTSDLCCKLIKASGALSKIRHYVLINILLNIFYATFDSHMRYACQLLTQSETVNTHCVLILQKSALKVMFFSPPHSPFAPLFKSFKILTTFDRVKTLNTLFVHQHVNCNLPPDLCDTFNLNEVDQSLFYP